MESSLKNNRRTPGTTRYGGANGGVSLARDPQTERSSSERNGELSDVLAMSKLNARHKSKKLYAFKKRKK